MGEGIQRTALLTHYISAKEGALIRVKIGWVEIMKYLQFCEKTIAQMASTEQLMFQKAQMN